MQLEKRFHEAMLDIYNRAKEECGGYPATRFLQMLNIYGGLQTAKRLLASDKIHDGLIRLWECQRLDLTSEALILRPEFRALFTDKELKRAEEKLRQLDYNPKYD